MGSIVEIVPIDLYKGMETDSPGLRFMVCLDSNSSIVVWMDASMLSCLNSTIKIYSN